MRDNVWFTYKARIQAHQRLTRNDFHSQVILVWYALVSTVLSIVTLRHPKVLGDDTDMVAASISVVLLVVSMLVANRDFRGRSIEMRRNYLALQALYANTAASNTMGAADIAKYEELLHSVENHTEIDDRQFRVLHKGTLQTRKPDALEYVQVFGYLALRFAVLAALYLAPTLVLLGQKSPQ